MLAAAVALSAVTAAQGPTAIYWVPCPVRPGEAVLLAGAFPRLEELVVGVQRLADAPAGKPRWSAPAPSAKPARLAKMLQARDSGLVFDLPDLGGEGVYLATVYCKAGRNLRPEAAARLNAAEFWWALGDAGGPSAARGPGGPPPTVYVTPGGWLRIAGRCLALAKSQPRAALLVGGAGGRAVELKVVEAGTWHLLAAAPATLKAGEVGALAVHNGRGPADAWDCSGYSVRVVPRTPLPPQLYDLGAARAAPAPATVDVSTLGANGADNADDTDALQAALAKAGKAGGPAVVLLPRGRFLVSAPLRIPPHVLLRGAGEDLTAVCVPDTETPPEVWVEGSHHFAIEDLTLYCSNQRHIIAGDMSGDPAKAGHVCLRRVRVRGGMYRGHLEARQVADRFEAAMKLSTGGGDTLRFSGPDVVVADCDIYGSGRSIFFHRVIGGLVIGNHLHNGRWGWYNFNGCNDVVVLGNTFTGADLMATGGGYSAYGPETDTVDFYTARNTYELMHGWDREAFTSDAGGGAYRGKIASARWADGRLRVELAGDAEWGNRPWKGSLLAAVSGKGRGFAGQVTAFEGRSVTVRPLLSPNLANPALASADAWAGLFDDTTGITVTQLHRRYVFERNQTRDAGIAIQYFGTAVENVADGNRCWRAGGYHGWSLDYYGIQPVLDCQWLGNEVAEGNSYGGDSAGLSHVAVMGYAPAVTMNSVIRGSRLRNNACLEVLAQGDPAAVENAIIEGNTVEKSDVGLRVQGGVGLVCRNNRFVDCVREVTDLARQLQEYRKRLEAAASEREPIAYWSFDEPVGRKTVRGKSSIGLDLGTGLSGTAELAPGHRGNGLKLDGKGWAECGTADACNGLNVTTFTISAWAKPDTVQGRWGIFAKRAAGAGTPFVVTVQGGALGFEACDEKGSWASYNFASGPVLKAGEWQHVAAVVEEGKHEALYVNGQQVMARDVAGVAIGSNDQAVRIGWEAWGGDPPNGNTPGPFSGMIDEVKIWARALSAQEVAGDAAL